MFMLGSVCIGASASEQLVPLWQPYTVSATALSDKTNTLYKFQHEGPRGDCSRVAFTRGWQQ